MLIFAMVQQGFARAKLSLAKLFDDNAAFLLRQARRFAGPGVDADDVVQDVFLVAQRRLDDIDSDKNPGAWLYAVMRNVLREHSRRAARDYRRQQDPIPVQADPLPDASAEGAQRRQKLYRCLQQLPARQREALVLCEFEELSAQQAAQLLHTSEAAVFTLLTRGRKALKQAWINASDSAVPDSNASEAA